MTKLQTFAAVLELARKTAEPHLLLGNGFSIDCRPQVFRYRALFENADFTKLRPRVRSVFDLLDTTDFEVVMRALQNAAKLLPAYNPKMKIAAAEMHRDAKQLKDLLVKTIADSHLDKPADVTNEEYAYCRKFLANFKCVYTVNYDLLLYWAYMQEEIEPNVRCDDGFRSPENPDAEYVTWEVENTDGQNVHYLHGALHLFDAGDEIKKYTWSRTGVRLTTQIRNALNEDYFPIFVSEGTSKQKLERINHNNLLARSYRSFAKIGGALFVLGLSFAEQDAHILRLITRNRKLRGLFVGVHEGANKKDQRELEKRVRAVADARKGDQPLSVTFFSSSSAHVWR